VGNGDRVGPVGRGRVGGHGDMSALGAEGCKARCVCPTLAMFVRTPQPGLVRVCGAPWAT
jgi:hypothetical protein